MAKKFFRQCQGCYEGYSHKKERLPRKKKKKFKKFLIEIGPLFQGFWFFPTSCEIGFEFKMYRPVFNKFNFLHKYIEEIKTLKNYTKETSEDFFINENGRLAWYWETDGDYGGSSGLMPFAYSEEQADNTWAFDEVKLLVAYFVFGETEDWDYRDFVFPESIKDDKSLLNFIKNGNRKT